MDSIAEAPINAAPVEAAPPVEAKVEPLVPSAPVEVPPVAIPAPAPAPAPVQAPPAVSVEESLKRKREEEASGVLYEEPAPPAPRESASPHPPIDPSIDPLTPVISLTGVPRPIKPLQSHDTEHGRTWTPFDTVAVKGRRTYTGRIRPTTRLDVLLSCSDGDMPDFRRHVGSAPLFREQGSAKKQAQAQQLVAQQQKQAAARERAEMARAEEMAANRQHGYSTRVRNATKSFKVRYLPF